MELEKKSCRVLDYMKRTFVEWRIRTKFVCQDKQDHQPDGDAQQRGIDDFTVKENRNDNE
jgi:hypothetical protein